MKEDMNSNEKMTEEDINEEMEELGEIGEEEGEKNKKLKSCLEDLEFPVLKEDLLEFAKKHCPPDIVSRIEKTSAEKFNSLAEVEEFVL